MTPRWGNGLWALKLVLAPAGPLPGNFTLAEPATTVPAGQGRFGNSCSLGFNFFGGEIVGTPGCPRVALVRVEALLVSFNLLEDLLGRVPRVGGELVTLVAPAPGFLDRSEGANWKMFWGPAF